MNDRILQFLTDNKDDKYADFQRTLITSAYPIIGVRTPLLKKEAAIIFLSLFILFYWRCIKNCINLLPCLLY
mgnify:CR=1 FL=1